MVKMKPSLDSNHLTLCSLQLSPLAAPSGTQYVFCEFSLHPLGQPTEIGIVLSLATRELLGNPAPSHT